MSRSSLDATIESLTSILVGWLTPAGHWEGRLASSALATATAITALEMANRAGAPVADALVSGGAGWLARTQNADGGWGDTIASRSNLSTSLLSWAALSLAGERGDGTLAPALGRVDAYLRREAGDLSPVRLRDAVLARYGKDRTFSAPILTVLAMTGRLGNAGTAWALVPQLPFELAACSHHWFHRLNLPVVSYALPALIAIGQVRHAHRPTRVLPLRALRNRLAPSTRDALLPMQPGSGGYLEATPLTSFVVMSLVASGHVRHGVVARGLAFLDASVRPDGSWPIDTNLATWTTTLAVNAFGTNGLPTEVAGERICEWLLSQQQLAEHPFTHAAPGGWAWTNLSGGVPDADDTAGALVALHHLAPGSARVQAAAGRGLGWLIDLQNRDGGVPTFCRGWGALPFDRSAPDLTAHALQAWAAWEPLMPPALRARATRAAVRARHYLVNAQRPDGSWRPLWFGNEHTADESNPVYGTARVLAALAEPVHTDAPIAVARARARDWLLANQNVDGGWGGAFNAPSSIEETGVALQALARCYARDASTPVADAGERATAWLADVTRGGRTTTASPFGLYFARLWYDEALYPLVFALGGLLEWRRGRLEE